MLDLSSGDGSFRCFCEETNGVSFAPPNSSVDLEPNVIDHIRKGTLANVFHPEFVLNGKQDAVNNFACVHCTVGKEIKLLIK